MRLCVCLVINNEKRLRPVEARTPHDLRRCAVVTSTEMLAADPLNPACCEVGPAWIGLVSRLRNAQSKIFVFFALFRPVFRK